jgi:hypothetical protein
MGDNTYLNTIGQDRADCIETMKQLVRSGDHNNFQHLHIENERYYDSLSEGSEAKKDLKTKWDEVSLKKKDMMQEWEIAWKKSSSIDRHDLVEQKKGVLWWYETQRMRFAEQNYHYFKTYWDGSNTEYPLE